nr:MAG TPA: puncturing protein [Caudoviricetes sp.]
MSNELTNLVTVATGKIQSVANGAATVLPSGVGADGAAWPAIPDCPLVRLSGSNGLSGLRTNPVAGDSCLLLFAGHDQSAPLCLPCVTGESHSTVELWHGDDRVLLTGGGVRISTPSMVVGVSGPATIKAHSILVDAAQITLKGAVTAQSLAVTGAITNGGVNIGAGHRHSGVEQGTKVSGGVV